MKQKIHYPKEFIGIRYKKYKLIREYKWYALYESEQGWKICFDIEGIRSEMRWVNDHS